MRLPELQRREMGENMIPLINVVFLLLIFFMLAGTLAAPEPLQIRPPAAISDAALESREWMLLLSADGELALDGVVLPAEALAATVSKLLQEHPDARLKLKADADLTVTKLIQVMDALRAAGAERVILLTQKASS